MTTTLVEVYSVTDRHHIVAVARDWLETPYRHQFAKKGLGCDCLGLVRGVFEDVYGYSPENPPPYSPSWGEVGPKEHLLEAAARHLVPVKEAKNASVLVFRMKPTMTAKHCAILTDEGTIIHAYISPRKVVEHSLTPWWEKKIAGVFDFPDVS